MLEIIWRLRAGTLDDEARLSALIAAAAELPGLSPRQYDLNQKGQWRAFDLEHIVVDALTQRTQLVNIRGEEGAVAMVALGKRGEQPTAIIKLPDAPSVAQDQVAAWTELYEALALVSTLISSDSWRRALAEAGVEAAEAGGMLPLAMSWRPDAVPTALRTLDAARIQGTPVSLEARDNHVVLRLADIAADRALQVEGGAHKDALEYIAERLGSN
jgi:hypothetical protein